MSICASPIKAERARFTLLDICGNPITGEDSAQVTSDSFTEIDVAPNYEDGQQFIQRKANGTPCVNETEASFLTDVDLTVQLCTLDADLIALVTGGQPIEDGDDFSGVVFADGLLNARFSVEVWQPVAGLGACDPEGDQQFIYWAFPHLFDAKIQNFTFQNDVFEFSFQAKSRAASLLWDIGDPYLADTPASDWEPGSHYAYNVTTVAMPEVQCGAITVPDDS